MRRPVVFMSGAFGAGICGAFLLNMDLLILVLSVTLSLIFVICLYFFEIHVFFKEVIIMFCFISLGGLWFAVNEVQNSDITENIGKCISMKGVIVESDIKSDSCNLVIKKGSRKWLVKYYGDCEYLLNCTGKQATVYGFVELPQEQRNPRCFDYRLYLKSCNIHAIIKANNIWINNEKGIHYLKWSGNIKDAFRNKLKEYTDDLKCGLIMAIIFGEKAMLEEDLYDSFQKNGTAHILAVSGLHTGIIYAFFVFIWRWKKSSMFYIVITALLLFYMSLADFAPSVVRAGCMILLHLIAEIFKCRYDLLNAAALTFFIMILHNPYQLFHTGFQMSFLAVASMAVIIPFVKKVYNGIFLSSIAIQAGMIPYTAYVFNYISIGSILANIPVIFIAGILLPIGVCALFCVPLSGELFGFLAQVMELCCGIMVMINDFFFASGKTSYDVISPPVWLLIIYYGVMFFVLSETGQLMIVRKENCKIMRFVTVVCMVAVLSTYVTGSPFDKAGIVFVDVGQGDCIHIRTPSGKNYLVDGGGDTDYDVGVKTLKPYLLKNGVRKIDVAFVTHLHEDHYGGIKSLSSEGMIDMIGVYEANRYKIAELESELDSEILYIHKGYSFSLDDGIVLEVISPEAESEETYRSMLENEEDENKMSLIMKITYKGKTLLVTGDIDEEGEQDLIKKYSSELSCDIMKVPHHGSKYSSSEEFVKVTNPALAVFQVGRNNYGHPSAEAIARYRDRGCETARNDTDGAIGLIIDYGKTFEVIKMFN